MSHPKTRGLLLLLAGLVTTGCFLQSDGLGGTGAKLGTGGTGGTPSTTGPTVTTPPTVDSTSPTNGAMNVAAGAALGATFSEALDPSTVTGATFTLTNFAEPVAGAVTYAGTTATFAPSGDLAPEGSFVATISTGVTDVAGTPLATTYTWAFTTASSPTVTAVSPQDGAQGVAINRPIDATFSVAMDPATITAATFLVNQGTTPVPGAVTLLGTTATFTPTMSYAPSATLTATITTGARSLSGVVLAQDRVWSFQTGTTASQPSVALGLTATFAVLASSQVANTVSAGTVVTGDLGISPGTLLSGFPPGVIVGQTLTGAAAAPIQVDLLAAYNDATGRQGAAALPADLAGLTFTPGLYRQVSAVALSTGSCTLDAQGDTSAVFIFQIGTAFGLAAGTEILLSGGASATNVYWAVGASVTLGASSTLEGTVLAATAITLGAGATVDGRLLAQGAAVTLNANTVTVPAP
jgi:Ice-binding-like/Bacterial Ig-like domain